MRTALDALGRFAMLLLFAAGIGSGTARADAPPIDPTGFPGSPDAICALLPGEAVPAGLQALDREGHPFDLDAALHDSPTLLIFYRGGW